MNQHLLIVGAGIYSLVAKDIAVSTNRFDKIDFIDDNAIKTPDGTDVIGTVADIPKLSSKYKNVIIAIGNPNVRNSVLRFIKENTDCSIITLISPLAYISPSARIEEGSIIEPFAVVHSACVVEECCIISAGAVVNHGACCSSFVHVDCNSVVAGNTTVPSGTKVFSCTVYKN